MLNKKEIRRAVDMQVRSYRLLLWTADAVTKGFIDFKTVHEYTSFSEATTEWILTHYLNIPENARINKEEIKEFSAFFTTYLENSFDIIADPGKRLYSPGSHCFCPCCSWMVNAPNLKTKKPSSADKRRARKLKISAVQQLALNQRIVLDEAKAIEIVDDPNLRESTSMVTYAYDLLNRMNGIAIGPAVLVLWRGFAWTRKGSPKKNFELSADMIFESEEKLNKIIQRWVED